MPAGEKEKRILTLPFGRMGCYGDYLVASKQGPGPSSLAAYLANITGEDWGAEFKRAALDGDYQLRKAVASLGNHGGGELFVGVEDDKRITGTALTVDTFYSRLCQRGPTADWYTLDLSTLVESTREIGLSDPSRRVLVALVRVSLLPGLVVNATGELVWYERRGRSDHTLLPQEWVESIRRFERGKLLLELYREFAAAVSTIPQFTYGQPVAATHFSLPRYDTARRDGSIFTVLTAADQDYLHTSIRTDEAGFAAPGLLARYLLDGTRLDRQIADYKQSGLKQWDSGPSQELRVAAEVWKKEVTRFRTYLEGLGVLPRQPTPTA
ncbi:MAG: putative DNA binding domain-containing protein [Nitrososphaerota archaeon]|nr:putative DNA binding domain-containing protein [Nitrososphaerota archaeon]